ncbi:MAG: hypothetical protein IKV61_04210 [Clostridia bacterium]|nr:hypothetical protein [Clostridia bacterium]
MSLYEDKLNLENTNKKDTVLDVNAEPLFNGGVTENLAYAEPKKQTDFDVLYKGKLLEEKLSSQTHAEISGNLDVTEEVLFKTGVEDIILEEDAMLSEETLSFKEPVRPDYVTEEVLFSDNGEQLSMDSMPFISEPINNEENALIEDGLEDETQLSFDDIDVNVDLDESYEDFEGEKVDYKKKSFAEKMFECDPIILERYDELKNLLLIYKKVRSRISNTCDTFKFGSTQIAKISTSGKSLKLYLNLEMSEVEPRLKCKEAGHKKAYEEVPVFLKIRSPRSMRNAKYLINQLATKFNLVENPKSVLVNSVDILKEKLN